jgi:autotransporter family porin
MGKPLNWILSDSPAKGKTSRILRSRLALTTILAVVPFLGYGRQAYADCDTSAAPLVECSGTITGGATDGTFIYDNAYVTTVAPFTVTSDGLIVAGEGHIQFIDYNTTTINNDNGTGLSVTSDGDSEDTPGAVTIITGATITGNDGNGIYAYNAGSGDINITVDGDVSGTTDLYGVAADGIYARNEGTNLNVTTGAQSYVFGTENGIDARNYGEGSLSITADGFVTGYYNDGIFAVNGEDGDDLTITTGALSVVRGGGHGIGAFQDGRGDFTIEANGFVAGYGVDDSEDAYSVGDGIHAINNYGEYTTIVTGVGSTVRGVDDGIDVHHDTGSSEDTLSITVNGTVTGRGVNNNPYFPDYNRAYGIEANNQNYGSQTVVNVGGSGLVEGRDAGIYVYGYGSFSNDQDILITNDGTVRNLSGESHDLAIRTDGGEDADTVVNNNADLIGNVRFDAFFGKDTLNNAGFWNMAGGDSDFGGSSEDEVNNTGLLVAADDSTTAETSRIFRLERFDNDGGLISLIDGQEGDTLLLTDRPMDDVYDPVGTGALVYTGTNGRLAVDAALGPGAQGVSDELHIDGSTVDTTNTVHVNVVAATGANFDGIPVVRIISETGTTLEEHFDLAGPVAGGFFLWDMRLDEPNNWHELYMVGTNPDGTGDPVLGPGASEFTEGFGAGSDVWLLTVGTVLHRQADLRAMLAGLNVTPVADFAEEVEPTPVATITPGFWFKGLAAYVESDEEQDGFDLDRKQTIWGGMAGFDFGTREAVGDALLFGLFGGYIGSDLEFDETNTEWNYEGPTLGAYVTYLDHAFYADLTVKADFLDIDIDAEELGGEGDTDMVNVGGRLDTGYKFGETAFIEPQASLAVVHTEIDDVDIFGGTVEFDDETDVRGRLGLRFGVDHTNNDATVLTADVTASVWEDFTGGDNDVTIIVPGVDDVGLSGDGASTYGDLSLGLSAANPDGWSSFVRGNYLFAEDYEAFTGNAGVRFVW